MGVPAAVGTAATVTLSVTEPVPGDTTPVELEVVVVVVGATTWKHSFVVVVDWDPRKLLVSGVYTAEKQ